MSTSGEMTKIVAEALAVDEATATSYFRVLRTHGLVTTGGRGRSAPAMTFVDVAQLLIVLMSADRLSDAAEMTGLVGRLELIHDSEADEAEPDFVVEDIFPGGTSFLEAMAQVIAWCDALNRGDESPPFYFKKNSDVVKITVSSTSLSALIAIGSRLLYFQFSHNSLTDETWADPKATKEIISRSNIVGMTTSRSIRSPELFRILLAF